MQETFEYIESCVSIIESHKKQICELEDYINPMLKTIDHLTVDLNKARYDINWIDQLKLLIDQKKDKLNNVSKEYLEDLIKKCKLDRNYEWIFKEVKQFYGNTQHELTVKKKVIS